MRVQVHAGEAGQVGGFSHHALEGIEQGVTAFLQIVITAVVFAGFHLEPVRFLILLPTGLVLGWVRWKTGSTAAAMVTHGLVNAPGAVLLLLGVDGVSP